MKALDYLGPVRDQAVALLRQGWTQGDTAVDDQGDTVEPSDYKACRWCLTGAIDCAVGQIVPEDPTCTVLAD